MVVDTTDPTIECPPGFTMEADASCDNVLPEVTAEAVGSDNCDDDPEVTQDPEAGEVIGTAVRTRERAEPVFVSVGHRVSLAGAVATVLACTAGYRIPEPIRMAHTLVNRLRAAGE